MSFKNNLGSKINCIAARFNKRMTAFDGTMATLNEKLDKKVEVQRLLLPIEIACGIERKQIETMLNHCEFMMECERKVSNLDEGTRGIYEATLNSMRLNETKQPVNAVPATLPPYLIERPSHLDLEVLETATIGFDEAIEQHAQYFAEVAAKLNDGNGLKMTFEKNMIKYGYKDLLRRIIT